LGVQGVAIRNIVASPTQKSSSSSSGIYTVFPRTRQWQPIQGSLNVSLGTEEQTCPEVTGSNATTRFTLLWARNPLRGNSNHWQASQEKA